MAEEFTCVECGSLIVRIIAQPGRGHLCALCEGMPGWFRNPELREILAPWYDDTNIPDLEKYDDPPASTN
jgi:hypothetical protein